MEFNIYFRALRTEDAGFINSLRRDEAMENKIGGNKRFVALERERQWIHDLIMNDNSALIYLAVCELGSEEIIGYTSISEIDSRNGKCFWSGIKIGPEKSDYGYGFQVGLLVLRYVFEELRMERCEAQCLEEHRVMVKLLDKLGFKKEGLMRSFVFKNNDYKNTWLFSILRNDYIQIKEELRI